MTPARRAKNRSARYRKDFDQELDALCWHNYLELLKKEGKTMDIIDQNVRSEHPLVEGTENQDDNYSKMVATNRYSGKREPVILMESHKVGLLRETLRGSQLELRADLKAALVGFTKIQLRVLHYVLVQGQSIETATSRMGKSSVWWRRWLNKEALPKLRARLVDYAPAGKVVAV